MAVDTGDKVIRKYANFRGVDFRGEDCSLNRSPDALNVWRNYKKLASIETRPGLEHLYTFPKGVKSMKWHGDKLYFLGDDGFVHALHTDGTLDFELTYVGSKAFMFEFDGKLYAKGSADYVCVTDGKSVVPYIPTTMINGKPGGGGKTHQDVNMLSPFRINTFYGDDKSNALHLDSQDFDKDFIPEITINGKSLSEVTLDDGTKPFAGEPRVTEYTDTQKIEVWYAGGHIELRYNEGVILLHASATATFPLPEPLTTGQDNIAVKYKKASAANVAKIMGCTMATEFDNRVFFYGNPSYPATMWHSSLDTCAYISDLDEYTDGAENAPIRSVVAGNNALWVFKDQSAANNSVFYHVPTPDAEYGKVYPRSHSSISLGCVGRAINFNDDIVFFSQRGMESASTDITTEQFATHKSSLVDRELITRDKYKDMILAEWEGYLLVFVGNEVFLADSRATLTNEGHYEYEWYHWELGKYNVTCATVHDGVLYIGTDGDVVQDIPEGHIYALTRDAKDGDAHSGYTPSGEKWQEQMYINSYWTTPKDKFGVANKLKTTNKKGCVVEALGDVDVYAKVEDTDFELINTNGNVEDYFVSRIKRKKWKDIQLKFASQTSFCLESATLEAFIGGYIKR